METVKLTLLAAAMGCETAVEADINHICTDSRKLTPGCLFVALKGENFDGETFIPKAVEAGAKAYFTTSGTIIDDADLIIIVNCLKMNNLFC